ncbi:MAG: FTR1 family protein, partial [Gemmatimonadota bacterium]
MRHRIPAGTGAASLGLLLVALGCGAPGDGAAGHGPGSGEAAGTPRAPRAADAGARAADEVIPGTPPGGLVEWVEDIRTGLRDLPGALQQDPPAAGQRVTELYLSRQEYIERYYGAGGPRQGGEALSRAVVDAESRFHDLMRIAGHQPPADSEAVARAVDALEAGLGTVLDEARAAGVPLHAPAAAGETPGSATRGGGGAPADISATSVPPPAPPVSDPDRLSLRTAEVASVVKRLRSAEEAYGRGEAAAALSGVESAYLEGFEPLEARLPVARARRVEGLIHLRLRPEIASRAPRDSVSATFAVLYGEMREIDAALAEETPFWLGAFNAFAIIFREGLEAVLLIGAILAYLARVSEAARHRRQVYAGIGVGVGASLGTWLVARLFIPVGGASRELIEGFTGLLAVVVLLYVSNWLFQKTYVQDWKAYLTERVGRAVTTGSALAMATLAFAAVYREGFETVLFYQALLFDAGAAALLTGFLPGLLLIGAVGVGIVRVGLRLPLRRAFGVTNAILIYLAFVFVGKGVYNLQEAGLFAPTPVSWVPDHELTRQVLGVHPVGEALLAQAALLLLVGLSYLYYRRRAALTRAAPGPVPVPAPVVPIRSAAGVPSAAEVPPAAEVPSAAEVP